MAEEKAAQALLATLEEPHPLLQKKEVLRELTWREWEERWAAEWSTEGMISLLHLGFKIMRSGREEVSDAWVAERVIRYLRIADQHDRPYNLRCTDDSTPGFYSFTDPAKRRGEVARKAFTMVCQNVFHDKKWKELATVPGVIESIVWFLERNGLPFGDDHNKEVMKPFLKDFLDFAWGGWRLHGLRGFDRISEERRTELALLKPRIIALLAEHGLLHLISRNFNLLTRRDLNQLREMATQAAGVLTLQEVLAENRAGTYVAGWVLIFAKRLEGIKKQQQLQAAKERVGRAKEVIRRLQKQHRQNRGRKSVSSLSVS